VAAAATSAGRRAINYAELAREVQDDWSAAKDSKVDAEWRRIRDYQQYRRFRRDVKRAGGVSGALTGPFGWSKLTVPIIFWIVETIVPRVATQPPTLIVKPKSVEAVAYAQAKEMELQDTLEAMKVREAMHRTLKQTVIYGDGPVKMAWDSAHGRPRFIDLNWFDWFLSPDARTPDEAEVIYHRSWYTRRQLQRLSRYVDRNGKPLFHGLEHVVGDSERAAADTTLAERREAAGVGSPINAAAGGQFCLVEAWYQDGTVVVFNEDGTRIHQVRTSPIRDEAGQPIRPFIVFNNTSDPESPYSIGDAEMLEDHQSELSTLRNQAIDQTTVNIAAPVIYSGSVTPQEVDAAFGQPGGKLRVSGDVRAQVMRMPPGAVSSDFSGFYTNIREEAQFVSGVNDNQAGQAAAREQTATEINIINAEANKRWQFKIAMTEIRFAQAGRLIDLYERRYGAPGRAVVVPAATSIAPGQKGLMGLDGLELAAGETTEANFARLSPFVNHRDAAYEVSVKAGTLAMPSEMEQFQEVMTLVQALSANPAVAQYVRWNEVARLIVNASSFDSNKLLLSEQEIAQQQMVAQLEALAGQTPAPGGPDGPATPAAAAAPAAA
jgi:hypothetical protein